MMEELVARYPIDGIHHDYVRYPDGAEPDSSCFCDYCLRDLPRHALLQWETASAHDVLPTAWNHMSRAERAEFILNGRAIAGGAPDLRYFFYDYRTEQITRFVREAAERVRRINPKIQMTAAVSGNPVQSGRYQGQKWSDWNPWIDAYLPKNERSHFPRDFDAYCAQLTEITARQMEWTHYERPVYAGIHTPEQPQELVRAVEAARRAHPDGIAIWSAGTLTVHGLWEPLTEIFQQT